MGEGVKRGITSAAPFHWKDLEASSGSKFVLVGPEKGISL